MVRDSIYLAFSILANMLQSLAGRTTDSTVTRDSTDQNPVEQAAQLWLIYWLCLYLGSTSVRAFGFGLSFHPILVLLGVNLYYVCSSLGQGAVFDVAPPTTAPPAARNWWG